MRWIALGIAISVVGCQSPGGGTGSAADDRMAAGKRVFYGKCIACHVPEPIGKFTVSQWREIVADMAPEAKLTQAEEASLLRYVLTSREAM